ncbi:extracellular solute-binding protein [Burkholderia vietnamiensis]|nr:MULTISPECIES: extracellular solute-binding protein [Burkholderiaceae]MCB4349722.1 extracellular solute-binding protein [Burkholderia vietnamiensis]
MRTLKLHKWVGMLVTCTGLFATAPTHAADAFRVAYAGSMGVVMDRFIGPAFAKQNGVEYQGIGQGAYGLARQLQGKLLQADVFISITPGPIDILKQANMIGPAVPVASTEMVITYSPQSKFAPQLAAAAEGKKPWYEVLRTPGLHFGRTDPATDPQGQNIIFTMLLAESFYKQPGLAEQILGDYQNPQQIFAEPSLLSRLEAGQIDASSGYLSAARSHKLPFITLPDEINLSNPDMDAKWYKTVRFSIKLPSGKTSTLNTQPLVFYATVLKDSKQLALAEKFVQFLASPEGQKMLQDNGYSPPKGGPIQ